MSEFNFKSQICTSIEQSRRLLELGLKKETADMCYSFDSVITQPFIPSDIFKCVVYTDTENKNTIPAWSLHRLMSMLTAKRKCLLVRIEADLYDVLIDRIEHEIKKGYFRYERTEETFSVFYRKKHRRD